MKASRIAPILLAILCGGLITSSTARADKKKADWFEAEDEGKKKQEEPEEGETAPQEEGETTAPQEGGEVAPAAESKRGGWLMPKDIAVWAGIHVGLGGTEHAEVTGLDADNGMAATIGFQLGGEYVLHKYFAGGAEFRLSSINTKAAKDADLGRDKLIDLVLRPRGRYVFESIGLEAYGTLPFGLSFPFIAEKKGGDADVGFTLGIGTGANYFLSEHWGIGGDFTWMFHWYGQKVANLQNGQTQSSTVRLSQATFFFNAIYAL